MYADSLPASRRSRVLTTPVTTSNTTLQIFLTVWTSDLQAVS